MRIFVYEHVTGGGFANRSLPDSLGSEGWAMLTSLLTDFSALPDVNVCATIDRRYATNSALPESDQLTLFAVDADDAREQAFDELVKKCDASLIVAPESEEIALQLVRRAESCGAQLLGSKAEGVALASDKLTCAAHLREKEIPALTTVRLAPDAPPGPGPWVTKPRHGAGSQRVRLLEKWPKQIASDTDLVVMPYHGGMPVSVLSIVGNDQFLPLMPCEQNLSNDGTFRYLGGSLPLTSGLQERAVELARKAVASVSGLHGFVGVDLLLDVTGNAGGDVVVEINPRVTTSYVGLRALAAGNLAGCLLRLLEQKVVQAPKWHNWQVSFSATGAVRRLARRTRE